MRVSFVLTTPYRAALAGGAERWVAEAARALERHVELSVEYVADGPGWDAIPRARRHRFAAPPLKERDRFLMSPGLVRAATRAEVIHIHQFGTLSAQLTAFLGRLRGRAVFCTDLGSSGLAAGRRLRLDRLFHGFLELSEFAASHAPSDRRRIVYGGVDTDRFRPARKADRPYAVFVGRILPHKGVDWLIRSLPDSVPLVVAGRPDPGYLAELHALADGKEVTFEIDPPDDRIAELYASAAVAVLPSVTVDCYGTRRRIPELLGLTALEALACGTPVICSHVASLPEVVRPGTTGLLVDERDERGLREALEHMATHPGAAAKMGAAGRADVLARFTWDRVAERCLGAYRELGAAA